jgi:hypothetical protein
MKLQLLLVQECAGCAGDLSRGNHSECYKTLGEALFEASDGLDTQEAIEATQAGVSAIETAIALQKIERARDAVTRCD